MRGESRGRRERMGRGKNRKEGNETRTRDCGRRESRVESRWLMQLFGDTESRRSRVLLSINDIYIPDFFAFLLAHCPQSTATQQVSAAIAGVDN